MPRLVYMRKQTLLLLLFVLFAFTGCDKECSNVDCIIEPFVFRLTDAEGANLLDNGSVKLEQVSLQPRNSYFFPPRLAITSYGNETWLEAAVDGANNEYILQVEGYDQQRITIDHNVNRGECCTSVTIEDVYLNAALLPKSHFGRTIILP